ncbi:MAG: hypothetical protein Ct9H90mP16_04160 [Candidatus Poseidoniales archaeon]|nr:MAG: hypothetical protein Ct9H90mP16_04160 [Candidatus Poseidoniales archaeon]
MDAVGIDLPLLNFDASTVEGDTKSRGNTQVKLPSKNLGKIGVYNEF